MRKSYILLFLVFITSSPLFPQLGRNTPPPPGPAPEIKLSDYESFELQNGLKVFVVENHKLPVVSFSLVIDRDPIFEGDSAGYVAMAGELLKTGTKSRTKDQIDEEIDFIGASLSTSSTGVSASALTSHTDKLLEIMSDVVINPAFRQEELDKIKKQTLSELASAKDEPETIAERLVQKLYYGQGHPYSEFETEETVGNIKLDMCRNYYDSFFKPNIAYLAVVGDITKKDIEPLINKYFGSWQKGEVKHFKYTPPQTPSANTVAISDRPNAVQSTIRIGYPVELKIGSPDAIKAGLTNTILGGGEFRLFKNLREKHAYTYGAYSRISPDKLIGNFTAFTEVKSAVTDSAVFEILNEMKKMRTEAPADKELQQAKNYTSGNFAIALEKPSTIANFAINIAKYNLPRDYYKNYLKNLQAVSASDVLEMAKKYIEPEKAYIIVVGNARDIAPKLKRFSPSGQVTSYDIYAQKLDTSAKKLPEGTSARKVLDNYISAIGGRENLLKIKDRTSEMTGNVQGVEVNITIYQKQPNKLLQEIKAGNMRQSIVFNGTNAYSLTPAGRKEITGTSLNDLKLESTLNLLLEPEKFGITSQLSGIEKVEGKDAYRIELQAGTDKKWTEYYDVDSGLKLRQIKSVAAPMGTATQTVDFSDYRNVEGIKYPFRLRQTLGSQQMDMQVTSIKVNNNLKDSIFEVQK
ncbi:MAG: insulinase family protein [Ignavibacteria bacterium]|jgi:predicted Zn-dependent peptidase|nr:insulinase family protein [Ignavibacteria bacterium]MCU7504802.1 insulinase family protein [Ignavibacteria bacterium]MCU7517688.1 insulinase family protein [Ignavibacteria bacterium]